MPATLKLPVESPMRSHARSPPSTLACTRRPSTTPYNLMTGAAHCRTASVAAVPCSAGSAFARTFFARGSSSSKTYPGTGDKSGAGLVYAIPLSRNFALPANAKAIPAKAAKAIFLFARGFRPAHSSRSTAFQNGSLRARRRHSRCSRSPAPSMQTRRLHQVSALENRSSRLRNSSKRSSLSPAAAASHPGSQVQWQSRPSIKTRM